MSQIRSDHLKAFGMTELEHKTVWNFPIARSGDVRLATPSGGESSSLKLEMEPGM